MNTNYKTKPEPANPIVKAAQILSDVVSPLLVPTYCMALAMSITSMNTIRLTNRVLATLAVAFITCIVPLASIIMLMKLGKVSDHSISDRSQRTLPYGIAALCYAAAGLYINLSGGPLWLTTFFLGAAFSTVVALVVTHWWKISAHATAVGGMAGFVMWLGLSHECETGAVWWMSAAFLLTGALGTSRLILNRHTLAQVAAGTALGLAVAFGCMKIVGGL